MSQVYTMHTSVLRQFSDTDGPSASAGRRRSGRTSALVKRAIADGLTIHSTRVTRKSTEMTLSTSAQPRTDMRMTRRRAEAAAAAAAASSEEQTPPKMEQDVEHVDVVGLDDHEQDKLRTHSSTSAVIGSEAMTSDVTHEPAVSPFAGDTDSSLSEISVSDTEDSASSSTTTRSTEGRRLRSLAHTSPNGVMTRNAEAARRQTHHDDDDEVATPNASDQSTGSPSTERRSPRTRRLAHVQSEMHHDTSQDTSSTEQTDTSRKRGYAQMSGDRSSEEDTTGESARSDVNASPKSTSRYAIRRRTRVQTRHQTQESNATQTSTGADEEMEDAPEVTVDEHDGAVSEMNQLERMLVVTQSKARQEMLRRVEKEIDLIHSGQHPLLLKQLEPVEARRASRLSRAKMQHTCALQSAHALFDAARQQAWQDFETRKWSLRRDMTARTNDYRARLLEELTLPRDQFCSLYVPYTTTTTTTTPTTTTTTTNVESYMTNSY